MRTFIAVLVALSILSTGDTMAWDRQNTAADVYGNTPQGAMQFAMASGMNPSLAFRAIQSLYGGGWNRPTKRKSRSSGTTQAQGSAMPQSMMAPVHSADVGYARDPLQNMINFYDMVAKTAGPASPVPLQQAYGQGPGFPGQPMKFAPRKGGDQLQGPLAGQWYRGRWNGTPEDYDPTKWIGE